MQKLLPNRFPLVIVLALTLAACGSPAATEAPTPDLPTPEVFSQPATETAAPEPTPVAVDPAAPTATLPPLDPNNLPDVPRVEFQGNNWFQPTASSQIAMVSGKVQLWDFSAVW